MITEKRHRQIIDEVQKFGTISVLELVEKLDTSESTIRRDLNILDKAGKLIKVRGGATAIHSDERTAEQSVDTKKRLNASEKDAIAKYAAATLRKNDFVFIDAGTTTERMIDYITEPSVTFVTNGFTHARKLARKGYKVFLLGGEIKSTTEAVVGSDTVDALRKYNFTKCYMGTNGITVENGFTTPDIDEAAVKSQAVKSSYVTYILADGTKFGKVSSVTFADIRRACVITDRILDESYEKAAIIKEVSE